jgi:actin-related protein
MCFVTQDFDAELKQATEHNKISEKYALPGGDTIELNKERIQCPELMFNPLLFGKKEDGIHKYLHDCIIKCDNDIRKDLFKNIVLAGGSTMFKGMKERMKKEI